MASSSTPEETVLLLVRPPLPDPDDDSAGRGPLMMEAALSALHSLRGRPAQVSLEMGCSDGKIGLFVRASRRAAALIQSQLYGQYPDAEIEEVPVTLFDPRDREEMLTTDLFLTEPDVFPIRRHAQFVDLVSRQNVDTLAGMTSALVHYPLPGMRGHIQICFRPLGSRYRRRALKFLPFLERGLAKHWTAYAKIFVVVHLARGWRRWAFLPFDILLGGFRGWFSAFRSPTSVSLVTGQETEMGEGEEMRSKTSLRSHDREDSLTAAVDKLNRLLFEANVRVSVIAPSGYRRETEGKVEEIVSSFRQFSLQHCNGFHEARLRSSSTLPVGFCIRPFVLSVEEIATLWHVPTTLVQTPTGKVGPSP